MTNNRFFTGLIVLWSLLSLTSCSSELTTADAGRDAQAEANTTVHFQVGGGLRAATRASESSSSTVASLATERTITTLHAVVFKGNEFWKLIACNLETGTDETDPDAPIYNYTFKMGSVGSYTLYFVANADAALQTAISNLANEATAANKNEAAFEKLVASQSAGDNTSTSFLMTSRKYDVLIEASSATGNDIPGTVEMVRASVRMDIDATALGSDFKLKKVIWHNRYSDTRVRRADDERDMSTPTLTKSDLSYVRIGTPVTGDVDLTALTDDAYDRTWESLMYGYENRTKLATDAAVDAMTVQTAGATVVEIIGDLHGIEVNHKVVFAYKDGSDDTQTIELLRNHLYQIVLTLKDTPEQYAQLSHTISVVDWTTGTEVEWAGDNLAQKNTPEILEVKKYIWDDGESDYGDAVTVNTSEISTNNLKALVGNKKMKLTIKVKAGSTGANIKCPALGDLGEITNVSTPEKDYDADGNILQTWTVTLVANASKTAAKVNNDPIVFNIYNQLDATAATTLKLNPIEMQQNALWWVAEYNMKTATTFEPSHSTSSQYCWQFDAAQTNFNKTVTVSGTNYHLPNFDEQISIVPMNNPSTGSDGTNILGISNTDPASPLSFSEQPCNIGGNSVSASTSYMYKAADGSVYAVRFIGTDYASAWHYKWDSSPCNGLLIESYLVDVADAAAAQTLLSTLATSFTALESGTYNGSSTKANLRPTDTDATDDGYCQRFLPACGIFRDGTGAADRSQGTLGNYWSATAKDSSLGWIWSFNSGYLNEIPGNREVGWSVRLFRDY